MCMKCDGFSDEQIAQWLELTILTHGWALQGVMPSEPDDPLDVDTPAGGWTYTVGATENFGLPELIITNLAYDLAGPILNWAVEFLRDGGTLDGLVDDQVLWTPVHDDHLAGGLFISYIEHYDELPKPGGVLQLFPSTAVHAAECVRSRCVDLSAPGRFGFDRRSFHD